MRRKSSITVCRSKTCSLAWFTRAANVVPGPVVSAVADGPLLAIRRGYATGVALGEVRPRFEQRFARDVAPRLRVGGQRRVVLGSFSEGGDKAGHRRLVSADRGVV